MAIEINPSGKGIGADIRGADLTRPLSGADAAAVLQAWHDHLVLRFRGPVLSDPQLIGFTRHFGVPDRSPLSDIGAFPGVAPEVTVVSNIVVDGKAIGTLGAGEASWHTDSSCELEPPDGSILHALEVPPRGGNTQFCNMYAAYERLPADIKAVIADKKAVHDGSYTSGGALRKGKKAVTDVSQVEGARHPLVRTHPGTGRRALFLGRRLNAYIVGMKIEDSERLLDQLWSYATQEESTWTQEWTVGDSIMWDNRVVMHRRDEFDPATRRLMHRTQLKGAVPV